MCLTPNPPTPRGFSWLLFLGFLSFGGDHLRPQATAERLISHMDSPTSCGSVSRFAQHMSKRNSGELLRLWWGGRPYRQHQIFQFFYLTNIYPALAEARNSTVIKGSLALCSHGVCILEVSSGMNQIIKDDCAPGRELGTDGRITARWQLRDRLGETSGENPSCAQQAMMDEWGEEAPAS